MRGIACTIERVGRYASISTVGIAGARLMKTIETWKKWGRWSLRFRVQTLMAGGLSKQWKHEKWGGGRLYKYEGRTPINVHTGGRGEVMQT